MTTRKANIIKIIVCVILACILLAGNIVMSYAIEPDAPSTDNPDTLWYEWNEQELAEFWQSLMPGYIMANLGVIANQEIIDACYDNFVDIVDGLSADLDISYDDWIALHFSLNPKDGVNTQEQKPSDFTVSNYIVDTTMVNVVNQAVQETLAENPLSYIEVAIPSVTMLDTQMNWTSYGQYKSIVDFCSGLDEGYVSFAYWYAPNTTKVGNVIILYVPKSVNYGLIGTVNGGLCDITYAIDWQVSQSPYNINNKIKRYSVNAQGVITEKTDNTAPNPTWRNITNKSSFGLYGDDANLMSTGKKTTYDYVFPNVNAFKAYNSGSPQPYYFGSEFGYPSGSYSSSNVNTSSVKDAYNQITNNITTGMSADEVITLVDTILNHFDNSGGSGGSGSGNGHIIDFSSISDLIASIGALIGELITGLAEGLTNIVAAIRTVITTLRETLTSGIIFEWLTELIAWLPSEIRTLIIALFTLTVIFACIKLVKGIL